MVHSVDPSAGAVTTMEHHLLHAVSRLVDALAASGSRALAAIRGARSEVRQQVWELAGASSPAAAGQVIVDIDGVLVLAYSEKQDATATWN
ncbi:ATP-dependent RNA helicase [Streptomyces sp. NL15-2K]|nr:ATP-dependent RNA helicase [Streptomyces sp. NL15-2K]